MPFAAIADQIRPTHREDLLAVLNDVASGVERTPDPVEKDGTDVRILRTATFVADTLLVRGIQYEGDVAGLPAALAGHEHLVAVDRAIAPYVADPGPAGRLMRCVQQRIVREVPEAKLAAIRYRVRPGCADEIARTFTNVRPEARPVLRDAQGVPNGGLLHGVAVFVHGGDMVRLVSFSGEFADVVRYMATRPGRPEIERQLAPYLTADALVGGSAEEFTEYAGRQAMRDVTRPAAVG